MNEQEMEFWSSGLGTKQRTRGTTLDLVVWGLWRSLERFWRRTKRRTGFYSKIGGIIFYTKNT